MRRRRPTISPGDGDSRHGSTNGYCNLSCRCGECREAWRQYIAGWASRQLPLDGNDPRHGRYTTYRNRRCRCARCREAHRVVVAQQRAAVKR